MISKKNIKIVINKKGTLASLKDKISLSIIQKITHIIKIMISKKNIKIVINKKGTLASHKDKISLSIIQKITHIIKIRITTIIRIIKDRFHLIIIKMLKRVTIIINLLEKNHSYQLRLL